LRFISTLFLGAVIATGASVRQDDAAAIDAYRAALVANPDSGDTKDALKRLIDRPHPVTRDQYERIQQILREYPWTGQATLVRSDESGARLIVSGTIRESNGAPVDRALLHVFHTDASGQYTRESVMDEPHARLFAYIRTRSDGRFEFRTIRPGGYPGRPDRQGEQWRIPQHVHFEVAADGYQPRSFQMVFEDDPRMTPYWHEWAARDRHPIVRVRRDADGVQRTVCDISLEKR
jgi:protocatechuate 3,4-dioxygenase beta subunit